MSYNNTLFLQQLIPYVEEIKVMLDSGVFEPPTEHSSQIILHYNEQGQLARIERSKETLFVLKAKK